VDTEEAGGIPEEPSKIGEKVKDKIVTRTKNLTNLNVFANYQVETPRKLLDGQGTLEKEGNL